MEVIKDILKFAGIGGAVTLVVLGVSVRDGSVEPEEAQARGAVDTSTPKAPGRRFAVSSERPREAHKVAGPSPAVEPSDLLAAGALPRSVRPLPRLSGAPYPMAALDGDAFATSG